MKPLWALVQILRHHLGRVLIDFVDPLVVAKKVALTDVHKYISIYDIEPFLSSGTKGISGTMVRGKNR